MGPRPLQISQQCIAAVAADFSYKIHFIFLLQE